MGAIVGSIGEAFNTLGSAAGNLISGGAQVISIVPNAIGNIFHGVGGALGVGGHPQEAAPPVETHVPDMTGHLAPGGDGGYGAGYGGGGYGGGGFGGYGGGYGGDGGYGGGGYGGGYGGGGYGGEGYGGGGYGGGGYGGGGGHGGGGYVGGVPLTQLVSMGTAVMPDAPNPFLATSAGPQVQVGYDHSGGAGQFELPQSTGEFGMHG